MRAFILILLACLSNFLVGCASTPPQSLLEERAGYRVKSPNVNLAGEGGAKYLPTRVPEKVIVAWLHEKELSPKVYFWGGWLSVSVIPESWEMKAVGNSKNASASRDIQISPPTKETRKTRP